MRITQFGCYLGVVVLLVLSCLVSCDLPADIEPQFEGVFKGEGQACDGTSAAVQVSSEQNEVVGEGEVRALSQAIAESVLSMEADPTVDNAVAQAAASAELVLEVVAQAQAKVAAQINSPNPGCWAIAFGKAQAVAIARAAVTAIADAFGEATNGQLQAVVSSTVENVEKDVEVAVETIALLLANGAGSGKQSAKRTAVAEARAKVVNCALAQAFAAVGEGIAESEVLTAAGCVQPAVARSTRQFDVQKVEECDCYEECGLYGDQQNKDYICYMKSLDSCSWAQRSYKYESKAWRYCGPTMEKMQSWLKLSDESSDIVAMSSGYGYSGSWDFSKDTVTPTPTPSPTTPSPTPTPTPSTPTPTPTTPTPTPTPTPSTPTPTPDLVLDCPVFSCVGDAGDCCDLSGASTCTTRYGRTYNYVGQCGHGIDVWQRGSYYQCMCH